MEIEPEEIGVTPEEMEACIKVLHLVANSPNLVRRDNRFKGLVAKAYREGKRYDLQLEKDRKRREDRELQAQTAMVQIQRDATPLNALPPPPTEEEKKRTLHNPECCYICKAEYTELHHFYHILCPECAELNFRMRNLSCDLTGRVALVTGGRVKIGHQTVLRLLRDGARVIVTTRFPNAAAERLDSEPDSAEWRDRVQIYGLDLRNLPAIEMFTRHLLATEPHLDILIHNAAQTIRRPIGFYDELAAQEENPQLTLTPGARQLVLQGAPPPLYFTDTVDPLPALLPHVRDVLPADALHDNEERADSRNVNSWLLRLDDVTTPELLEVQLVNSIAPFIINSRLKPLMMRSPHDRRFIVNVSAMEGQFRRHKTVFHPHTNMAKAALNMMTRTSGEDYAKDGIYMTSVDTGWVTDENPTGKRLRKQERTGFFAPLDIVDGMARIYHPIAMGIISEETPFYGLFLKDFAPCPW